MKMFTICRENQKLEKKIKKKVCIIPFWTFLKCPKLKFFKLFKQKKINFYTENIKLPHSNIYIINQLINSIKPMNSIVKNINSHIKYYTFSVFRPKI